MTYPSDATYPAGDPGPLVTPTDLALYLGDQKVNEDRAAAMIDDATTLCCNYLGVTVLPAGASVVVKRVAGRGYVTVTSSRSQQASAGGSPFGVVPGGAGGIYLTSRDERDLSRASGLGGGGAFSIDLLPAGYVAPSSWNTEDPLSDWDTPA